MLKESTAYFKTNMVVGIVLTIVISAAITPVAYGHGGKTHGGEVFTTFQALKKAAQLYDRLIASGKLDEDWETGLKVVDIDTRQSGENREYEVRFERTSGEPRSVYFFFDQAGQYAGSNFTGK